jgi:hypothetical protein
LLSALFSIHIRVVFLCALLATGAGWSAERVSAQAPLAAPIGLEVVGELRPGTPNIPLFLIVQWDPVEGAESYELERAEPAATLSERAFAPIATIVPPSDQLPGAKVRYVDEAGFGAAGGHCFRVRAVRGTEVGDWAEVCLPVPPSSGGPPPGSGGSPATPDFAFGVEFSPDYEFTVIDWTVPVGFEGTAFEVWAEGTFVPVAVLPPAGRTGQMRVVIPSRSGCWVLRVPPADEIDGRCDVFPPDLRFGSFRDDLVAGLGPVGVRATGRTEAPVAVLWRASDGPTDLLFRIERVTSDGGSVRLVSLSYAGSEFVRPKVQAFFDPAPGVGLPCYRVTAVSSAGESLIGEACLDDAPGPPDAGSGLADRSGESGATWMLAGIFMVVLAGSLRRTARVSERLHCGGGESRLSPR